jgi:hypothetical protein
MKAESTSGPAKRKSAGSGRSATKASAPKKGR